MNGPHVQFVGCPIRPGKERYGVAGAGRGPIGLTVCVQLVALTWSQRPFHCGLLEVIFELQLVCFWWQGLLWG